MWNDGLYNIINDRCLRIASTVADAEKMAAIFSTHPRLPTMELLRRARTDWG